MKSRIAYSLAFLLLSIAALHAAPADPLRLDPSVRPVTQALDLSIDPDEEGFHGLARVELLFENATNRFRFHAKEIDLGRATIDGRELRLTQGDFGLITASAAETISAGTHRLDIAFRNDFNRDGTGFYKTVVAGRAYVFSQMEADYARRSFPCWDEPSFKIPWRITVRLPANLEAVANMPAASVEIHDGNKAIEFGRTPPMPSYLVALAIGPLDFLQIPGQSVPGRVYTAFGQSKLAQAAAEDAGPLLTELERYFGVPYPYPKLDHIGVPEFRAGAMENAGAITYRDSILLLDPANANLQQKRALSGIIAHEMAHMWFGDLVTMAWWDDLWLNESFATWMSYKIAGRVHPEQRLEFRGYETGIVAREGDANPSVKPIRRPFTGGDNLEEAFDVLSYNKGQAILRMVEGWLGDETMRQALRRHFLKHAWGNARAEDLWAAFAESGESALSETLRAFVEQPGLPRLIVKKLGANRIELRQQRYRTVTGENVTPQRWQLPVVLRHGTAAGDVGTTRVLLTNEVQTVVLQQDGAVEWIYPNKEETGYYTWSLPEDLAAALTGPARKLLTPIERLGLLSSAKFELLAGVLPPDDYLRLILSFAEDPETEVKGALVRELTEFQDIFFSSAELPLFNPTLRRTLRPMLQQFGLEARPSEAPEISTLRSRLLVVLGTRGNDREVIEFCRQNAARQLREPRNIDPGIAVATLLVASWNGDRDWFEALRAAFENAPTPDIRGRFRTALTFFANVSVERAALDYLLTPAVRSNEVLPRRQERTEPEHAAVIFDWVVANYDALKLKLGEDTMPSLVRFLEPGDQPLLARGRAFFLDPSRTTPLAQLNFQKAAEGLELRETLRSKYANILDTWRKAGRVPL